MTTLRLSDAPARRPLRIYASDPMAARDGSNIATIQIANEPLLPGPLGERVVVIDYDGSNRQYYRPVDLDDKGILMRGGLDPTESDPRFHQQMVYAVAMKTIEHFDRALGRRIDFRGSPLRLMPHAFHGANAFYDRSLHGVVFGYFKADGDDPGANLPGQNVFTCLSHDIIAHEVTHALVDRLRPHFMERTNLDVPAFHEGFSDIVALFQHFTFKEQLIERIQGQHTDLRARGPLVELATQFGYATGTGHSLRSALGQPDRKLYSTMTDAHDRGEILVAAVFDGFFTTYQRRIQDLIRIATGGSGLLPEGYLHPDLVNRVATEAARAANGILTMCIRAFEYLPPVDITFGDYLRALVTADYELVPDDEFGQRAAMIEGFRVRGIYPEGVASLAEESLLWPAAPRLPQLPEEVMRRLMVEAQPFNRRYKAADSAKGSVSFSEDAEPAEPDLQSGSQHITGDLHNAAVRLHEYATANAVALGLDPTNKITVAGFHCSFRVAPDGQLLIEVMAQFTQKDDTLTDELGGLPARGGTTIVAAADGTVRYVISKPLPSDAIGAFARAEAERRLRRQRDYIAGCDRADANLNWCDDTYFAQRMKLRMSFAALHGGSFQ